MVLVVGGDQGEGHRQIRERVGGQEQKKATQVEFVDAERTAEVLQDGAAMRGHVELLGTAAEDDVDKSGVQVEEESRRIETRALDAHAVFEERPGPNRGPYCRTWPWGARPPGCCETSCNSRSGHRTRRR